MVKLTLFLLCGLIGAFASPYKSDFSSRIVGGQDAAAGQFPYQVSIRYKGNHLCGGSILDEYTVLTAAQCIDGFPEVWSQVVVGTNHISKDGVVHEVSSSVMHPDYNKVIGYNDIGIIKVETPIVFNDTVQAIKTASEDIDGGEKVILSGWGSTSYQGSAPNQLQFIELKTIDHETCSSYWSTLVTSQLCTLTQPGEGVCNGDAGSPLVDENGQQVGIVSRGSPCAKGVPDIYTRVSSFQEWIEQNK